jgi:hypothetical protein
MVPVALAVLEKKRGALWSASGLREPVDRVANLRQHLPYPSIEGLAFADARRGRCFSLSLGAEETDALAPLSAEGAGIIAQGKLHILARAVRRGRGNDRPPALWSAWLLAVSPFRRSGSRRATGFSAIIDAIIGAVMLLVIVRLSNIKGNNPFPF